MKLLLVLAALALFAGCGGTAGSSDSGIRGQAFVGICAVEQEGMDCTAPLEAEFQVRRDGRLVQTVRTGRDGRFLVQLDPGTYVLVGPEDKAFPILKPVEVTVRDHEFADVTLGFDSGIR